MKKALEQLENRMTLSFIVPAHNEAPLIKATVRAIVAAARTLDADYEIIVVDDSSTDETAAIAGAAGASVVRATCRQIAVARNTGARASRGDVLVFVDADTLINAKVASGVMDALRAGAVGGGARVFFDEPVPIYARILLNIFQWLNARTGIMSGCFLFCTRPAFDAIGGFDERLYAAEEVFISRALGRQGRIVILKQPVITSGRKLRAYSAVEIFCVLLRLAVCGTKGIRDRRNLEFWYGPRREDPV